MAQKTVSGHSSLDRKRRSKDYFEGHTFALRVEEVSKPCVELALDAISREFGEQGRMRDCIKSLRYLQRNGPDLMSNIEGLHPFLGH